MFVHAVYFWLREDLTEAEHRQFIEGLRSLIAIDGVKMGQIGIPAPTNRPVIDRSYSQALLVLFDDKAAHDAYQAAPIHHVFVDRCATFWKRIVIYDSVAETAENVRS